MDFSNSLFMMPLMTGVIFIIAGYIVLKFPPKKINSFYGYRTSSSMKNQERWDFAQVYSSILMIYSGLGLTLLSVFGLLFKLSEGQGVLIGTIMIIIAALVVLYKTEKAINQKFKNE